VYKCDLRLDIKRGRLRGKLPFLFLLHLVSALDVHSQQILPMPEAEAISLNDSYLFTAFALGKGFALAKELQRVHGDNVYTFRPDKQRLVAWIIFYWLTGFEPTFHHCIDLRISSSQKVLEPLAYWRYRGQISGSCQNYLSSVVPLEAQN